MKNFVKKFNWSYKYLFDKDHVIGDKFIGQSTKVLNALEMLSLGFMLFLGYLIGFGILRATTPHISGMEILGTILVSSILSVFLGIGDLLTINVIPRFIIILGIPFAGIVRFFRTPKNVRQIETLTSEFQFNYMKLHAILETDYKLRGKVQVELNNTIQDRRTYNDSGLGELYNTTVSSYTNTKELIEKRIAIIETILESANVKRNSIDQRIKFIEKLKSRENTLAEIHSDSLKQHSALSNILELMNEDVRYIGRAAYIGSVLNQQGPETLMKIEECTKLLKADLRNSVDIFKSSQLPLTSIENIIKEHSTM